MFVPKHRRSPARFSVVTALALVVGLTGTGWFPPAAQAGTSPTRAGLPDQADHTEQVTLITGDVVTVRKLGNGKYAATPRSGRYAAGLPVTFQTIETPGGALYVLPSDAGGLVAAGRLDMELFNVRRLVEDGRTDDETSELPVIVQFEAASRAAEPQALAASADALPASARVRALESIGGAGVDLAKDQVSAFWSTVAGDAARTARPQAPRLGAGVGKIWLSRRVKVALDASVPQIGAPQAWQAGADGTGVTVAVLDTGIDLNHPDVAGKVDATQSFVPGETVSDGHGHGTHVAATVAGTGAASGGARKGVAPGARLVIGKVLSNAGWGYDSWIIDGMEWAAASGARVVNMSLGSQLPSDENDPMSQAVDRLTATTGTLFVISAGNNGPGPRTIGAPGAAASALTVGAVDRQNVLASFSSRGPVINTASLKPDITAPGVGIVAARAAGTALGAPVDDHYTRASGTSMATPHVAGAAAILAQRHPDWKAAELKGALTGSARAYEERSPFEQGTGRVDVARALNQSLIAIPSSVSFRSDSADATPQTRTLALVNHGSASVTAALDVAVKDRSGQPVPGTVTVEPTSVTVPAGGSTEVAVTFHPDADTGGQVSGLLRAVDAVGAELLRVAIGADQPVIRHKLRLTVRPPQGYPNLGGSELKFWTLLRVDAPEPPIVVPRTEPFTDMLVPAGVYTVATSYYHYEPRTGDFTQTAVVDPEVVVPDEHEVFIDASAAKPVQVRTPRPSEVYDAQQALIRGTTYGGAYQIGWAVMTGGSQGRSQLRVTPTEPVTVGTARGVTGVTLAEPLVQMRVAGKPSLSLRPFYVNPHFQEPRLDIDRVVELVDVGSGTAEEIAKVNVTGKLALVSRPFDGLTGINEPASAYAQILPRLRDAGALAAVLSHSTGVPVWCEPARYDNSGCSGTQVLPLPVVRVGPEEGADLRALAKKQTVRIVLSANPRLSYTYNLRFVQPTGFGDVSTYRVTADRLTTTEHRFHASTPYDLRLEVGSVDADGVSLLQSSQLVLAPSALTTYQGPVAEDLLWRYGVWGWDARKRDVEWDAGDAFGDVDESVWEYTPRARHRTIDWNTPYTVGAFRVPPELAVGTRPERTGYTLYPLMYRSGNRLSMMPALTRGGGVHRGTTTIWNLLDPSLGEAHLPGRRGDRGRRRLPARLRPAGRARPVPLHPPPQAQHGWWYRTRGGGDRLGLHLSHSERG